MQYVVRAGDTGPLETTQLVDAADAPLDLTGATVRLKVRSLDPAATGPLIDAAGELVDAATGKVTYRLTGTNTDAGKVGRYMAEWKVTDSGGDTKTYGTAPGGWIPFVLLPTTADL